MLRRRAISGIFATALIAAGLYSAAWAQSLPMAAKAAGSSPGLSSNRAAVLKVSGDTLWVSTERTVNRLVGPGTSQFDFTAFEIPAAASIEGESITELAAQGNRLAVATAYTAVTESGRYTSGNGLYLSADGGETWTHHPVTEIMKDRDGMRIPGGDNLCFGLWFAGEQLWSSWTADYAAMTPDFGVTWLRYRPDSTNNPVPNPLLDDPGNLHRYHHLNYRAYDGGAAPDRGSGNDTIWVSTNAGVNRSTDGGVTWKNYDALDGALTGDFVPAVRVDTSQATLWAATQATGIDEELLKQQVLEQQKDMFPDGVIDSLDWDLDRDGKLDKPGTSGVSWSTDGGSTWRQMVPLEEPGIERSFQAFNFAFDGAGTVWVAGMHPGSDALLMTLDNGETWQVQQIKLADDMVVTTDGGIGDVAFVDGVLWVATGRGLARSINRGETWSFILTYPQARPIEGGGILQPVGQDAEVKTYAFPSPSQPRIGNPPNIVFALAQASDVTIRVYDAGSGLCRILEFPGLGAGNHAVTWDGRNGEGRMVANGVYLYEVKTGDGDSARGKLMVLN